jgi:hypothetical protein
MRWFIISLFAVLGGIAGAVVCSLLVAMDSSCPGALTICFVIVLICIIISVCLAYLALNLFKKKKTFKGTEKPDIPAHALKFLESLAAKIKYRRKIRQDVITELAVHFEDALRECQTEEEKQQTVHHLIDEFGDVKLLGKLVRRAKKRCRPLWKKIIIRTFQTAGLLILLFGLYTLWFLSGKPVITTNYLQQMNKFVIPAPAVDANQNAAPYYHQAAEMISAISEKEKELLGKQYSDANDKTITAVKTFLEDNPDIINLVKQGAKKPYYWNEYSTDEDTNEVIKMLLPHLADFRKIVYVLKWSAYLNTQKGDFKSAFDDLLVCYRFGSHLTGDKTFIEQLVGIAIRAVVCTEINKTLSRYDIPLQDLQYLHKNYKEIIQKQDFRISFEIEKFFFYDEIQRSFTADTIFGSHLYLKRVEGIANIFGLKTTDNIIKKIIHAMFLHPDKTETKIAVERHYNYWENISGKSPYQLKEEGIDIEKKSKSLEKGNLLLESLAPALGKISQLSYRCRIDSQATLVIIALQYYKKQYGEYPESLSVLIEEGLLGEIPDDPYGKGKINYQRKNGDFLLYSWSSDLDDDNGVAGKKDWAEQGDRVFWPIREKTNN